MVGRPEWPAGDKGLLRRQTAHDGVDFTHFQGFLPGHIRQNGRQALTEHAFAGTRRADQQHIVAARRCNLQRPLHILLPQHILEIQNGILRSCRFPQGLLL